MSGRRVFAVRSGVWVLWIERSELSSSCGTVCVESKDGRRNGEQKGFMQVSLVSDSRSIEMLVLA